MKDKHLSASRQQFEETVIPHVAALLRTAIRLSRNPHTADDLVQEAVFRAWKAFRRCHVVQNYKAWLFAIMFHLWAKERRKQVCDALPDADGETLAFSKRRPRPADADQLLLLREVLDQIDALPEEQRTVLLLSVVEELPLREIAIVLNVPIGTVSSRLGRARIALRRFMDLSTRKKARHGRHAER